MNSLQLLPPLADVAWLARITELDHERVPQRVVEPVEEADIKHAQRRRRKPTRRWPPLSLPSGKWAVQPEPAANDTAPPDPPLTVSIGTWRYSGCAASRGLVCGPVFKHGPLAGGHAHGPRRGFPWPLRYGAADGWYALTNGAYQWTTPETESTPM